MSRYFSIARIFLADLKGRSNDSFFALTREQDRITGSLKGHLFRPL